MGILNLNIEHLNYTKTEHLKDFDCCECRVSFNDKDLGDNNFVLGVNDYSNEIKKEGGTPWDQRKPFYSVVFCLKVVSHKECPATGKCADCYKWKRTAEMEKFARDGNWYCLETCWGEKAELRRDAVEKPKSKKIEGIHPEAINTVMDSVRKAQEKQVEQMKQKKNNEKNDF